jgi:hypothetical protein
LEIQELKGRDTQPKPWRLVSGNEKIANDVRCLPGIPPAAAVRAQSNDLPAPAPAKLQANGFHLSQGLLP